MAVILPQSGEPFILNGRTGLVKAGGNYGAGEGVRPSMGLAEGGESILW